MPVYTVAQVTSYVRETLERDQVLQDIWVSGEVANLARPGSGHSYFSLRDANSSVRCVMFRGGQGADLLDNGAAVIAHGRVSVYEVRGDLQIIVDLVQPEGVGELQLKLEQLRLKLEREGLFEPSRKRVLPPFPKRIGVITSPTGSVWHDIQTVVARRYPLAELALAPCAVQGDLAAPSIVEAFQILNGKPDIDVVILARGGGSFEDLLPFNEEAIARAVYSSRAPVLTAIGHETDTTIADLVADRRAPTPSAAAEMAVPDGPEIIAGIAFSMRSMTSYARDGLLARSDNLEQIHARLNRGLPDLDTIRIRVDDMLRRASTQLVHALAVHRERADSLSMRLASLSPKDTLRRGYAIVQRREDSRVVDDSSKVTAGDTVDVTVTQGAFAAEVKETSP